MFKSIKRFIKEIRHPAEKYETISKLRNNRGESPDELMKRSDDELRIRIRMSYPTMTVSDYMAYPTDKSRYPHRMGHLNIEENDRMGGILARIPNEKGEVVMWATIYRIVPDPIDLKAITNLLKGNIHDVYSIPYHMFKEIEDE
jgi:hypothetical protein